MVIVHFVLTLTESLKCWERSTKGWRSPSLVPCYLLEFSLLQSTYSILIKTSCTSLVLGCITLSYGSLFLHLFCHHLPAAFSSFCKLSFPLPLHQCQLGSLACCSSFVTALTHFPSSIHHRQLPQLSYTYNRHWQGRTSSWEPHTHCLITICLSMAGTQTDHSSLTRHLTSGHSTSASFDSHSISW